MVTAISARFALPWHPSLPECTSNLAAGKYGDGSRDPGRDGRSLLDSCLQRPYTAASVPGKGCWWSLRRSEWERVFVDEQQRDWIRQIVVEFIGPFALMFIGGGAIIVTASGDLVAIALAHGLAIGLMVAAAGHITGGLYNPALTVGLVLARRLAIDKGVVYIVSQLAGCAVAALALTAIFPDASVDAVSLGVPAIADGIGTGGALLAEAIATFFLMYAVFGTAIDSRGARAIAPLVIGLVITVGVLAIGPITGAALNPARAFGPALVQGEWADQWIYWVGPIIGAAIAALLYSELLMGPRDVSTGEPTPDEGGTAPREPRSVPARRRRR